MSKGKMRRFLSLALAVCIVSAMIGDVFAIRAFAATDTPPCDLCTSTEHAAKDCPDRCTVHDTAHLEVTCDRCTVHGDVHKDKDCDRWCVEHGNAHLEINCDRCTVHGLVHLESECDRCTVHGDVHKDIDCDRHKVCELCGEPGHGKLNCEEKCRVHGTDHLDKACPRHSTCVLCSGTNHLVDRCPHLCQVHGATNPNDIHEDKNCPRHKIVCALCAAKGHEAGRCPEGCTKHPGNHLASECPDNFVANDKVYITNYRVVDSYGNPLAKVAPGDKVIIAVTVIDERVRAEDFGITGNNVATNRIHTTMSQGAFSIPSSAEINAKLRNNVSVSGVNGYYNALCYTVEFRNVTYLGGTPNFGFTISYTNHNGNATQSNNIPMPYPQQLLEMAVTQATDDVPSPTIILNSANYGKVAIIGEKFNLSTVATNTSSNLDLENVSVKIQLPQGINMATGNSQVLIGNVPKNGTINHTFNLVAEGVANDITSLPVKLIYTFEAFVGGKRTQFTSEQDISVNVQQPTRFSIQSVNNEYQMYMGYDSYVSVSLVNKGKTTVYNVTAELVSETLTAMDVEFLGNVAPGSSTDASFDFTANRMGPATGKVLITYEDAQGTQSTLEQEFTIEVIEEPVWDEPVITEPVIVEKNNGWVPVAIGVVVVVAAAGGFVYMKKQKAKKLAELEDEDEDI